MQGVEQMPKPLLTQLYHEQKGSAVCGEGSMRRTPDTQAAPACRQDAGAAATNALPPKEANWLRANKKTPHLE